MSTPLYVSLTDKAFLRLHHGYGAPVISQALLVLDEPLPEQEVRNSYELLRAGPLARRVRHPAVPLARARWVPTDTAYPLDIQHAAVDEADIVAWGNDQAQFRLDPEAGYGWRLSVAPTRTGGMVISFIASHAVVDGHSGLLAAAVLIHPELATKNDLDGEVRLREDLVDGMRRGVTVARQAWSEARRAVRDPRHRAALRAALRRPASLPERGGAGWEERSAVLTFDAAQWNSVAARYGGTSNTLYLALAAEMLRHCSLVDVDTPLVLMTAVRMLREQHQLDSNSFSRVPIPVQREWLDNRDLTALRRASKAAFGATAPVGSGATSRPRRMPPDLIDVLPDGVVHRLAEPTPLTVGMCSNMGVLDPFLASGVGTRTSMFAVRAVFQGLDVEQAARQPIALATWLSEYRGKVQWVLEGLKPEMARSDRALSLLAGRIADSWGLTPVDIHTSGGMAAIERRVS
ncbi:hypothetical protein NDR87_08915 [Nocardia sp. CDC159]|uniref:Uncharacterized protein n=1 Tax=Nocardia pulmonis TaxID=2951408 RepID=A0A9X2IWI3_9NOCA|nr:MULTISPECIES: hypothetical protein [Nocardia]MCM6773589.1 hypothetical protein [Nocardia pulmonis]MCM6786476.1 hypothetical protein [Nocardia sp. CDC159]